VVASSFFVRGKAVTRNGQTRKVLPLAAWLPDAHVGSMKRIGSLFSGIGGLELGLEWAGVGHTVWQVERDTFCRSVLERHWPNARRFDDVHTVGAHNLEPVDVICGGFPCQDISYAGKGLGLAGERSGLWFEFARVVGEMGPRFVVVENVAALITRGIGDVLGTLSDLGYDAQWRAIRASDVGAPHRRERIFIVANAHEHGSQGERSGGILDGKREALRHDVDGCCGAKALGNADEQRRDRRNRSISEQARRAKPTYPGELGNTDKLNGDHGRHGASGNGGKRAEPAAIREQRITQSRLGLAAHGVPGRVARWPASPGQTQHEWEATRTVEKTDNRAAKLRALGNAVVPQVAQEIGEWLLEIAERLPPHER
jgi:DNA (cytosine-5)-methyltransferase 1